MVKKISHGYIKMETLITNILMIGVVFFVFFASVMRWAGYPIAWSVQFTQLLFVWVIFLGANRSLRENKHIGVDFFVKKLPVKIRTLIEILTMLLVMSFLIFIGIYGVLLSIENSVRLISNLTLSYSFVTLSVPVGCILMIFTIIFKLKNKILSLRTSSD